MKLLIGAFSAACVLWAVYEAYRRRAALYWYPIILFLPWPLGGLLYLVSLNFRSLSHGLGLSDLRPLEQMAATNPTLDNRLALADALEARGQSSRAEAIYRAALLQDPKNLQALHGLGRALMSLTRYEEASDCLAQVMVRDSAYANYSAALDYAEALARVGDLKGAISLLDGLISVQPRINHRLALAHYLAQDGQGDLARAELKRALVDYSTLPPAEQERASRWEKRARTMLAELALKE
jgi:hypothetical protein